MDYLAEINSVDTFITTPIPDLADDGTTSYREDYIIGSSGTPLQRIVVDGGGHTWPGGPGQFSGGFLGATSQDFSANVEILNFFDSVAAIPEPSLGLIGGSGVVWLLMRRRRRNATGK